PSPSHVAAVITDPLFYLLAIPAIIALGLGKGGFAGVGMISTPLLALTMPPLQAAAILLPILLCQDVISVWVYRRRCSAWNLKVLLPGSVVGVGAAWLFAAHVPNAYVEIAVGVTGVCFALYNTFGKVPAQPWRPSVPAGMFWGLAGGLHLDHHSGRRAALPGAHFAPAARQIHADRHDHHLLRAGQRDEARALFRARPVLAADAGDFGRALAVRGCHQLSRPLARAQDAHRTVLPDHVPADVSHLAGFDLARRQRHSCGRDGVIIASRNRRKRQPLDAAARAWSASMAKVTAAAIVAVSFVLCSAAVAFDLQGHRGARGLAPENTLAAFSTALLIGVTTLELDLAMTSDGILAVSHDRRLNPDHTRAPDGKFLDAEGAAIRSLTLTQLKRYDVGRLKPGTAYAAAFPEQRGMDDVGIPTLMEVFDLARQAKADHVRFNIETKLTPTSGADTPDPETFAAAVVRAVREAGLSARVSIQSFDWRTLVITRR